MRFLTVLLLFIVVAIGAMSPAMGWTMFDLQGSSPDTEIKASSFGVSLAEVVLVTSALLLVVVLFTALRRRRPRLHPYADPPDERG